MTRRRGRPGPARTLGWAGVCAGAGLLCAVASARAGDAVPLRDRLAVANARACPSHGAGFIAIPGSDACIRVSGRARAEAVAGTRRSPPPQASASRVEGRLAVDTRTETAYGPARAYVRLRATH